MKKRWIENQNNKWWNHLGLEYLRFLYECEILREHGKHSRTQRTKKGIHSRKRKGYKKEQIKMRCLIQ